MADILGRRKVFLLGVGLFAAASAACGAAIDPGHAGGCAVRPGARRGAGRAGVARADRAAVPGPARAHEGARHLGRARRARRHVGNRHLGRAHRRRVLALDLLRQPAGRADRAGRGAAAGRREPDDPRARASRLGRRRDRHRRRSSRSSTGCCRRRRTRGVRGRCCCRCSAASRWSRSRFGSRARSQLAADPAFVLPQPHPRGHQLRHAVLLGGLLQLLLPADALRAAGPGLLAARRRALLPAVRLQHRRRHRARHRADAEDRSQAAAVDRVLRERAGHVPHERDRRALVIRRQRPAGDDRARDLVGAHASRRSATPRCTR